MARRGDEGIRTTAEGGGRKIRAVHRRRPVGKTSVQRRRAPVWCEEKLVLLRSGRASQLSIRDSLQLDDVDELEQGAVGSGQPRLRLSARRCRLLVDVPARAQL